jgi:type I restriction enzyme S subunit
MAKEWPEEAIGGLLRKNEDIVEIAPDRLYRELTVRLWGKGVTLRREVPGAQIGSPRRIRVTGGQFILSRIDARNGAFGLVPSELDGAVVSTDFPSFHLDEERLLPSFLGWLSRTRPFVDLCRAASEGTTNRVRLKEDRFLATKIHLPPLPEQRRVVARIDWLAERAEEARRLRTQSTTEFKTLERNMIDFIYRRASEQYGTVPLENVSRSLTDGAHLTPSFVERGIPFIFVGNVSSGRFHFEGCKYVSEEYYASIKETRRPARGDVLFSAVGATLGIAAIVHCNDPFCFQRHVAIIKPERDKVCSEFVWQMLRSGVVHRKSCESITGTAQPTIPLRAIRSLRIPLPPLPEQRRIVAYLENLQATLEEINKLQEQTAAELDALIPSILDKAFKGKL